MDGPERFKLLASAVAGRTLEVGAVEPGEPAWTDGVTVFVDLSAEAGHQVASLVVQAALIGSGSLDPGILSALSRRPTLAQRYLAVEGHRALVQHELLLPSWLSASIDRVLAGRADDPSGALALAAGREELPPPPEVFGTLKPSRVMHTGIADRDTSAMEGQPAQRRGSQMTELREADDGDDGAVIDFLSSPVGGGGGIGRLLKRLFGEGRSSGAGPPGADAPTRWGRGSARVAGTVAVSTRAARLPVGLAGIGPRAATYPEWDVNRMRYRPDWCTVREVAPPAAGPDNRRSPDAVALRRPLGRIGMELERQRRQLEGDDIDVDAAVEAQMALRSGGRPDEAVYLDTVRRRRDLSVLILLDVSGSSGEAGDSGLPIYHHQRATAAALTAALHELGDRVALYGFRSQGRSAVEVLPAKRFADGLDSRAFGYLGGFVPGAYTRLGAAIRHGTAVLERDAGTSRRLLVVVSDGLAYDHGYERAYGEADSRRALAEARRRGIGCVCLAVGVQADDAALRNVFGTAAYAAIAKANRLPAVVGPLFRSALRSAESQRRAYQSEKIAHSRLDRERTA